MYLVELSAKRGIPSATSTRSRSDWVAEATILSQEMKGTRMKYNPLLTGFALLVLAGCSTKPAPRNSENANQVDMTVELQPSKTNRVNATVTIKAHGDGRISEMRTHSEDGTTTVTQLRYHNGDTQPYERETLTSQPWLETRKVENLNFDGSPSAVKIWRQNKGERRWLRQHSIYSLSGRLQWQERYEEGTGVVVERAQRNSEGLLEERSWSRDNPGEKLWLSGYNLYSITDSIQRIECYFSDGSMRVLAIRNQIGGMDTLITYITLRKEKKVYLLRSNAQAHLTERFDYSGASVNTRLVEYKRWYGDGNHHELEWKRCFDNGTLEVEMITEEKPDGKVEDHYRWYRRDGSLLTMRVVVWNHSKVGDGTYTEETSYRSNGKDIWKKSTSDNIVRKSTYYRHDGTIGMIAEQKLANHDEAYTWTDRRGRVCRVMVYLTVVRTSFTGEKYQTSELVQGGRL